MDRGEFIRDMMMGRRRMRRRRRMMMRVVLAIRGGIIGILHDG